MAVFSPFAAKDCTSFVSGGLKSRAHHIKWRHIKMKKLYQFQLLAFILVLLLPVAANAYTFRPGVMTFEPYGNNASRFFRLANQESKITPLEISITAYEKDLDGKPVCGMEADEEFIVFPSQTVLMPGDEQMVQVKWIGDPDIDSEKVYSINVREVPLPEEERPEGAHAAGTKIKINVLVNYVGRIYVRPKNVRPSVVIESASIQRRIDSTMDNGEIADEQSLEIICANTGTARTNLKQMKFSVVPLEDNGIEDANGTVILSLKDIPALKTTLYAGGRRRFVVPWPKGLPDSPVTVLLNK
jgi:fimbrial chaperone protein